MEKEATTPRPVCAQEALALLNCAAENPYDRDKCLALLDALRECIAQKKVKKFSLAEAGSTSTTEAPKSK
ncbi:hypothetical protein CFC21_040693 [Triticum aestivum]|uniref:CHCH domain-containing protein n=3 Tax=Triticum TaxID=4564 RepID=A0A3B6EDG4_WHEAT|nr:uncharacterized protein LOC119275500 [Triticum dicoccoides]XP_044339513.1 uncharacterized protein LOC123060745 [Triticum aestivum]XP_044348063.1 uncharacterized protein LOC123069308 [Triticum aestivum]VAH59148.1 unnamed protein product [Triticum turgidum subsp. durum]KAF7021874.1 hypothetical protein CFC21_034753 [Triticum aestivum]KAF7028831.1 hypothetical protein CFC21_040693 [Triticum aestivum]CDM83307.1 unnamed protein product [Triticum aestivum]VAH74776.1 unnamed protein product [Tri